MSKHVKKRTQSRIGERMFFLVFAAVTVFAWTLPLRPTVSQREKRRLEPFPAFSLSALEDGSYFEGIGLWFSDTFPARDQWISLSQRLEALYGRSDVMICGTADTMPAMIAGKLVTRATNRSMPAAMISGRLSMTAPTIPSMICGRAATMVFMISGSAPASATALALSVSQFVPGNTGMNTLGSAVLREQTWMLSAL